MKLNNLWIVAAAVALPAACGRVAPAQDAPPAERPNILWLTSEDHGPHMGCYGDRFATTPNVDALAARGMIYLNAWSNAPVCAPARTTLITGLHASSTGSEHMRSMVAFPEGKEMFPQLLRSAGYYATNNVKEDYNIAKPGQVWDASSRQAHWRNRPAGKPFFAVFNSEKSHESKLRVRPHVAVHDPAGVRVPAYHPDAPEVRQDWAQYYDTVTEADADAGVRLKELEADGLADDTIVFYFADHGSGMPRNKRSACNSGLKMPLVVHFPERWRHLAPREYRPGAASKRLVSLVDFAPTVLSLAGIPAPDWMQGRAFLGKHARSAPAFLHGYRGRMDERVDLVRSVTDGRYVYVRNYLPHLPAGRNAYMFQTPATRAWKALFDQGKLNEAQSAFWRRKAPEELYDSRTDPDEVKNLAGSRNHAAILARLRAAQRAQAARVLDVGILPEADMKARAGDAAPYDMARRPGAYPFRRVFDTAEAASRLKDDALPQLRQALSDPDPAVRWWGVLGFHMRGEKAVHGVQSELRASLTDSSPGVRVAVAEALAAYGEASDRPQALETLAALALDQRQRFASNAALEAIVNLGEKAERIKPKLRTLSRVEPEGPNRYNPIAPGLLRAILREQP